jgi:hypothetical protein
LALLLNFHLIRSVQCLLETSFRLVIFSLVLTKESIRLFIFFWCHFSSESVRLFAYLSVYLLVCLSVSLFAYLSVRLFVCPSVCLVFSSKSVRLFAHLSVYLFVCLPICLFICLSVHLFVCLSSGFLLLFSRETTKKTFCLIF